MTSFFETGSFSNSFSNSNPYLATSNPSSLPGIGFTKLDYVNSSLQFARPEKEDNNQSSLANYVRKLAQWHDHGRKAPPGPQPAPGRSRNSTIFGGSAAASKRSSQQLKQQNDATSTVKWQDHELNITSSEPQPIRSNHNNNNNNNNNININNNVNYNNLTRRRRERSLTLNEEEEERYGRFFKELSFPHSRISRTSSSAGIPSPSSTKPPVIKIPPPMPTASYVQHMNSNNENTSTTNITTNNNHHHQHHHHHHHSKNPISIITTTTPVSTTAPTIQADPSNLSSPLMPSLSSSSSSSNASNSNSNSNSEQASSYPSSISTSLFPTPLQIPSIQPNPPCFRQKSKSISTQGAIPIRRPSYGSWAPAVSASPFDNTTPNVVSPAASFLSQFGTPTSPKILYEEEGDVVGRYILGKVIGRGGFSTVREAYEFNSETGVLGRKVACKVISRGDSSIQSDFPARLDKEIAIWRNLNHQSIVEFLDFEETSFAYFVFSEYCSGGDLLHHMTSSGKGAVLSEDRAREIFLQVCEAVRYLHEDARVCHKDIKLENILLDDNGRVKLADFGLSEWMDPETEALYLPPRSPTMDGSFFPLDVQEDIGGSLAYAAPEQLRSSKNLREPATDIWSLAVVLYALVTGKLPFMDEYEPRLQYKILNVRYDDPCDVCSECKDLIRGCFKAKPNQRPSIRHILDSEWCCM